MSPETAQSPKKETEETRDARNTEACDDPKVGDYWSEMFAPIVLVVDVRGGEIIYAEPTIHPTDRDAQCWNYAQLKVQDKEAFGEWLHYSSGSSVSHKTWCDVKRGVFLNDIPPKEEWGFHDPARMTFQKLQEEATKYGYSLVRDAHG